MVSIKHGSFVRLRKPTSINRHVKSNNSLTCSFRVKGNFLVKNNEKSSLEVKGQGQHLISPKLIISTAHQKQRKKERKVRDLTCNPKAIHIFMSIKVTLISDQ